MCETPAGKCQGAKDPKKIRSQTEPTDWTELILQSSIVWETATVLATTTAGRQSGRILGFLRQFSGPCSNLGQSDGPIIAPLPPPLSCDVRHTMDGNFRIGGSLVKSQFEACRGSSEVGPIQNAQFKAKFFGKCYLTLSFSLQTDPRKGNPRHPFGMHYAHDTFPCP